jgi:hypothetical protein
MNQTRKKHSGGKKNLKKVLSRVACITLQITSRRLGCSEFIPFAHTFTQFTVSYLLLP